MKRLATTSIFLFFLHFLCIGQLEITTRPVSLLLKRTNISGEFYITENLSIEVAYNERFFLAPITATPNDHKLTGKRMIVAGKFFIQKNYHSSPYIGLYGGKWMIQKHPSVNDVINSSIMGPLYQIDKYGIGLLGGIKFNLIMPRDFSPILDLSMGIGSSLNDKISKAQLQPGSIDNSRLDIFLVLKLGFRIGYKPFFKFGMKDAEENQIRS